MAGLLHSGDVRSAPYPDGGRETVLVDVDALIKGHPTCTYLAASINCMLLSFHFYLIFF